MRRDYPRLEIEDFGRQLLETGDLDPVYIALSKAELEDDAHLKRWLIAYWCFYHCGVASWLSECKGKKFWEWMEKAAKNVRTAPIGLNHRWPRGSERRHFRGEASMKAVRAMEDRYGDRPEGMVDWIASAAPDYREVANRACSHPLFGPWISFKIADMTERVLGEHVDFSEAAVFMFKDPMASALLLWRRRQGFSDTVHPKDKMDVVHHVVEMLRKEFRAFEAPPDYGRTVGLQEIETILCKWKSHQNGHYPLLNDIREITEGLEPWVNRSETAKIFLAAMPSGLNINEPLAS